MNENATCAVCDRDLTETEGEPWGVSDPHALAVGYNLHLEDDDADASYQVCEPCQRELGHHGDTYVVVYPEVPDDPETGGMVKHRAVCIRGILTDRGSQIPEAARPIDPDGPVFDLLRAYVLDRELPAEWTRQYAGVPDDATEWEQVSTGWHSSMERSEASDRINEIVDTEKGVYGPVLVKFAETNNVCSIGLTIYAAEGVADAVRDYLKGATSAPGGAFKVQ